MQLSGGGQRADIVLVVVNPYDLMIPPRIRKQPTGGLENGDSIEIEAVVVGCLLVV